MTKQVDFIFDFSSPNAYMAHKAAQGVTERTGIAFNIVPCLLGGIFKSTGNQAPMMAFGNVKGKIAYEMLEIQRFLKKHGLEKFKFNSSFPVNSLILMRGVIIAESEGFLSDYVEAGLKAMWEDDKKMDDPNVFVDVMTAAGFNGADILEKTQMPEIKKQLADNTAAAVERGAFGIPTFYVGTEMFFGKDRLDQVEAEILAQRTA